MIVMESQPKISSEFPASHHYSLADAVNIILSNSLPENHSGEEFDARVEWSFNPRYTTDSNPTLCQLPAQAVFSSTAPELT